MVWDFFCFLVVVAFSRFEVGVVVEQDGDSARVRLLGLIDVLDMVCEKELRFAKVFRESPIVVGEMGQLCTHWLVEVGVGNRSRAAARPHGSV